jgi:hypothetical protein
VRYEKEEEMLCFGDSTYEARLRRDTLVEREEDGLTRLVAAKVSAEGRSAWADRNRRLMTWIGGLMIDWGCELQSRYAAESSSSVG